MVAAAASDAVVVVSEAVVLGLVVVVVLVVVLLAVTPAAAAVAGVPLLITLLPLLLPLLARDDACLSGPSWSPLAVPVGSVMVRVVRCRGELHRKRRKPARVVSSSASWWISV